MVTPVCDEDDDASATMRLGVDDGTAGVLLGDADTRGDGFAEDVGVGDTGTTVGLAVAVAIGFGFECVGVGVGVGVFDGVSATTVMLPVMYV